MGYVAICQGNGRFNGWYVNANPDPHSYTPNLRKAKRWSTRSEAESNTCGNETIVSVESQLTPA